jgi:sporulation protein YlmC with PRC-barrel domain
MNGKKVITDDAYVFGEVDGVHADTTTWQVTNLEVSLTKDAAIELGFNKPMLGSVTVCLPIAYVRQIGDVVTLNKPLQELKGTKECRIE